jgi:uncharacterized CHY-type Zn-finger protein
MATEVENRVETSTGEGSSSSRGGHRRHRGRRNKNNNNNQKKTNSGDGEEQQQQDQQSQAKKRPVRMHPRNPNRAVQKPKPKDARLTEINQLKKGYPSLRASEDNTVFSVSMKPSDPDFPFELEYLQFDLYVPTDYPKTAPYISVKNTDIPKGYSGNVEVGFREIAQANLGKLTLMNMTLQLDKRLEEFLMRDKLDTIKIIRGSASAGEKKKTDSKEKPKTSGAAAEEKKRSPAFNPLTTSTFVPSHVKQERERQVQMMKHRLKDKSVLFSDAADGTTFAVTIFTPETSQILPSELFGSFRVLLYIPSSYGVTAARITIPDVDDVCARNVEENFNHKAEEVKSAWSLLALLNYLSVEIEQLILPPQEVKVYAEQQREDDAEQLQQANEQSEKQQIRGLGSLTEEEKQRILQQTTGEKAQHKQETEGEENELTNDQQDHEHAEQTESPLQLPPLSPRGTALYLPGLQLSNIDYLECQSLNIVVKCTRCKSYNDLMNIASAPYGRESKPVGVSCSKCNHTLAAAFRKDIIHASNNRAGFLDLHGCTPFDLLAACSFVPTCSTCSTTFPSAFHRMEVAKTCTERCRECHTKMTMYIAEFRFEYMSDDGIDNERLKLRSKKVTKEKLGITGGTSLPNEGACSHYKKSVRWFRFSCCSKVFPCDKCHDEASDHFFERAHRIICGKCSREQNASDVCAFCRHSFAPRHSAFWEGGKGTRDPLKMSKKDPKKYKRKHKQQQQHQKQKQQQQQQNKKE